MKIALLPPLSYTYEAYEKYMKNDLISCDNIQEIIDSVNHKDSQLGIIPLENRIIGKINSYDLKGLSIIKKIKLPIEMALGGIGYRNKINKVISKKEALMQCSEYLSFNQLESIEESSTVAGIEKILEKNLIDTAAIGSEKALRHYGLKVYERDISNLKPNYTIFGVISLCQNDFAF